MRNEQKKYMSNEQKELQELSFRHARVSQNQDQLTIRRSSR